MQTTTITTSADEREPAPLGLVANSFLSLAVGALLAGVPGTVGGWLGVDIDPWLRLLGVALLAHGITLGFAGRHHAVRRWTKWNLAMIAPYPLMMIAVVATGLVATGLGRALILADGLVVGAIAMLQWNGLQNGLPNGQQNGLQHRDAAREPRSS